MFPARYRALCFAAVLLCAFEAEPQPPQAVSSNFLQRAFGVQPLDRHPLLSREFPRLSIMFTNKPAEAAEKHGDREVVLRAPASDAVLTARLEREGIFDICRIRPAAGSPLTSDELKLVWSFPMDFNESMTLDAGSLEGHPLYLPDGTIPSAHFLNYGTLFYNRPANLAIGTELAGAERGAHNWGRRGGPTGPTTIHFWTSMGSPALELKIFAYRPANPRLWWAEWYQEQERRSPGAHPHMFPVLSPLELSWRAGERQEVDIVPGPGENGKAMEFSLIDDVAGRVVGHQRFEYRLPVTRLSFALGEVESGLYRGVLTPAGQPFDPARRKLDEKMLSLIVRPATRQGDVLFVAPTDMWRAYASNGGHAMTSWRNGDDYDSVGYSPTVLNTRFRRTNHYYYGLYERYSDIQHYRFLRELAGKDGFRIDYCTQDDIALGRMRLGDYKLVILGNHAEFTTADSYFRFRDYLARGGAVMIHGGDSFAVMVEYLPSLEDRRYIWQRDHFWCLLGDQPDSFQPPRLLPKPEAGDAVDYLNVFHGTVGSWPRGSKMLVADPDHPVLRGLGLKAGDVVPGMLTGEADIAYEPAGWNVLLRSDRAEADAMSHGLDRVTQPPYHYGALLIHKNLRLAEFSGEAYTNLLADPRSELFQKIYTRTVHYLLDSAKNLGEGEAATVKPNDGAMEASFNTPVSFSAIRYTLPEFIDYKDPLWFRKPAPYAHYTIEASTDGGNWSAIADRTHGPWRGLQTDFVQAKNVRKIRFRGVFSNHLQFEVSAVRIFRAK